jgi:hypothetical protein
MMFVPVQVPHPHHTSYIAISYTACAVLCYAMLCYAMLSYAVPICEAFLLLGMCGQLHCSSDIVITANHKRLRKMNFLVYLFIVTSNNLPLSIIISATVSPDWVQDRQGAAAQ